MKLMKLSLAGHYIAALSVFLLHSLICNGFQAHGNGFHVALRKQPRFGFVCIRLFFKGVTSNLQIIEAV